MKPTRIIFLRHADTQKDPEKHASLWGLSPLGTTQAEQVVEQLSNEEIDLVYVSEEQKTALTVAPLARARSLPVVVRANFNEVARGEAFLSKEEFEAEKNRQLQDLSYGAFNGESGLAALDRFTQGVDEISKQHQGKTVLVATHGTVLNIYFAHLLGAYESLSDRWGKTGFCAYGITEDGVVVRDIIEA